ncbi:MULTISPECIES: branched-chain amino acid ABC transporter permease [Haloferax]|uniref:Branched-chain/neutral amino acids ABC transporter permease I n=1 Tax=Haloferax denitrificans ATCC 35960 TaxID=662478 RepID=M0JI23_9EURY|nr:MULTISPECIES: branched-chain amino acid ABC transporter permease [Haloferax]EMA07993.1 branched-chain/neutral amino acids ABC transporter permease I [Haloferax denitrificans ATCC 35960]
MAAGDILLYVFNGLYYAAILYLVSLGLSLTFGVMNLMNMSHAAFLGLGAYVAASLSKMAVGIVDSPVVPFLVMLVAAPAIIIVLAAVLERTVFSPLFEIDETYQLLGTFGVVLMLEDAMQFVWGSSPLSISGPLELLGRVPMFGNTYPVYNLLVIGIFGLAAVIPFLLFKRTKLGKIAQAIAEDEEMVEALGVDVSRVRLVVFSVATGFAGLGGALLMPLASATPGLSVEYILLAFAVVVIGGLGSLRGAIVGSILIGLIRSFGIAYIPELELAIVFLIMAGIILVKPEGLYGGKGVLE